MSGGIYRVRFFKFGAIAQLGERYNGIVEVVGSIPSGSTTNNMNGRSLGASFLLKEVNVSGLDA
tara:strand:- start:316 stop:507 length:192 start_codon:yes stop_codon:yes gene_type:complete